MQQPQPYRNARVVRFGECDPAGVVYYPIFFQWFHDAMEDWFAHRLGVPYAEVLKELGFPAARTEADFVRPCRLGDAITVSVEVEKLGSRSFTLAFTVRGDDETVRARGRTVCVCIAASGDGFSFSSTTIPAALRERLEAEAEAT